MTKVGLLTPYNGTNLGDGAALTATIQQLRRRLPGVEFLAFTLNPAETTRRHQIPALPITGLEVPGYSGGVLAAASSSDSRSGDASQPDAVNLRTRIRRLLPAPFLRWARRIRDEVHRILFEGRQLIVSYRALRSVDLLFVNGGGQLDHDHGGPWGHPYVLWRWSLLARLTRCRLAMVSVGAQGMDRPLTSYFLRSALSRAAYRSYRETTTKQRVAQWRFTSLDPVFPDLAFGIDLTPFAPRANDPHRRGLLVGISPMAYGHPRYWPMAQPEVYQRYIDRLAAFAAYLLEQDHSLLLFRSGGVDRFAIDDFQESLRARGGWPPERVYQPTVTTVSEFFREVAAADLVVASRLHGVLLSHVLGKPVLAVSFNPKVDIHMRDMDQDRYRVDIHRFELDELVGRFEALRAGADVEGRRIVGRVEEFRERLGPQYDRLAAMVRGRGRG